METFIGNLSPLEFAEGQGDTTEVQVFKQGTFRKGGRTIKVGPEEIAKAVANFKARVSGEPPMDYDHAFANGGGSEACGWFKDVYEKDGALWATVEWTQDAAQKIRNRAFRFFSPEFHQDYPDETGKKHGFTLLAGGLTNRPFLKNMAPITLSEAFTANDLAELREAFEEEIANRPSERATDMALFKNSPDEDKATIETLTEEVNTLKAAASESEALTESVNTLTAERDDLKAKLESAEADKGKAETTVEALNERIATVEKDRFTEKLDSCLTKHRARGAIDATDETTSKWTTRAEKHGVDFAEDLLSELPDNAAVPMGELGHGNDNEGAGNAPTVTLSDGEYAQDAEQFAIDQKATKLAATENIPYDEAVARVMAVEAAS